MGAAGGWKWESEHETRSEKLKRNKDAPLCQTVVMRDELEIVCACVCERDKDGKR